MVCFSQAFGLLSTSILLNNNMKIEDFASAIQDVELLINNNTRMTPVQRAFAIRQIKKVVDDLIELAKNIRENYYLRKEGDWRSICGIQDYQLALGQCMTGFLWTIGLRDKITDVIERTYAISFSGLGIYPDYKNIEDGSIVYLLYRNDTSPNVSFYKDGKWNSMDKKDFDLKYKKV